MSRVSDYAFINAKLRARIGIMRSSHLIDEMIKAPSLAEAVSKLEGTRFQHIAEIYRATGDLQQAELSIMEEEIASLIPDPEPDCAFRSTPALEGSRIDLGGRILSCIHTPGHTKGSVCYLDEATGLLFSGDAVNRSIILMRQPGDSDVLVEELDTTMRKLWGMRDSFRSLAIGHDGPTIGKEIIRYEAVDDPTQYVE